MDRISPVKDSGFESAGTRISNPASSSRRSFLPLPPPQSKERYDTWFSLVGTDSSVTGTSISQLEYGCQDEVRNINLAAAKLAKAATAEQLPTAAEIAEANRSWTDEERARTRGVIPAAEQGMFAAWLNNRTASHWFMPLH